MIDPKEEVPPGALCKVFWGSDAFGNLSVEDGFVLILKIRGQYLVDYNVQNVYYAYHLKLKRVFNLAHEDIEKIVSYAE